MVEASSTYAGLFYCIRRKVRGQNLYHYYFRFVSSTAIGYHYIWYKYWYALLMEHVTVNMGSLPFSSSRARMLAASASNYHAQQNGDDMLSYADTLVSRAFLKRYTKPNAWCNDRLPIHDDMRRGCFDEGSQAYYGERFRLQVYMMRPLKYLF